MNSYLQVYLKEQWQIFNPWKEVVLISCFFESPLYNFHLRLTFLMGHFVVKKWELEPLGNRNLEELMRAHDPWVLDLSLLLSKQMKPLLRQALMKVFYFFFECNLIMFSRVINLHLTQLVNHFEVFNPQSVLLLQILKLNSLESLSKVVKALHNEVSKLFLNKDLTYH